jgi:restriction endonuclease S subunit
VNAGWATRKLGDVATLQRGFDLPTRSRIAGDIPLVSSSGIIDTHNVSAVSGPGVVTGRSGSVGNVFFVEEDFWPLNTALYVKDFHGNDPKFIFHLLADFDRGVLQQEVGCRHSTGTSFTTNPSTFRHSPSSSASSVSSTKPSAISRPPKPTPKKNRQNASALFDSYLHSVAARAWKSCELVSLSHLATEITDGDHLPPPKSDAGIPFITIGNIVKQTRAIDFSDTFFVSREYFDKLKNNRKPKPGDVLYTVTGSFGIPVIVEEGPEFCFQRHIALVRPNAETQTKWLYYLLSSPQIRKQAIEGATGTAQKTVSLTVLRKLKAPKMPAARQRCEVEKLDLLVSQTQRLESLYQQKLAALEALKKSLLSQAFNGGL